MKIQVYRRKDKKWDWRCVASNGKIIATSGGQGYNRLSDLKKTLFNLVGNIASGDFHYQIKG